MKQENLTLTRYELEDGFYVEVLPRRGETAFWLGHRDCGVKELAFAASDAFAPPRQWETMIRENISDYLEDFREIYLEE